ncbi:MAG: M12 family metallo-peptidase [Gemmatimonadota bacterium]
MRRAALRALAALTILALALVNTQVAVSNWADDSELVHAWDSWHWDKSTLRLWPPFGTHTTQALRATNVWNNRTDLTLRTTTNPSYVDVYVWGADYGSTGWAGLASVVQSRWDWHCWAYCGLSLVYARYNNNYRSSNSWYAQKVFCHELGHAFGFDHNSSGGCMISGYRPSLDNRPSGHDVRDVNSRY